MKEYWDDIITSQSWEKLVEINKQYDFVLIGGWAVWLYTRALKSKDIDIIVSFEELSKLKDNFALHKNARLSKYEIKELNYDIDVYVEHFSNLGLPAEAIAKESQDLDGFTVPKPEMLLIAKQCAFRDRQGSIKGEKDKIDIFSILELKQLDFNFYKKFLEGMEFRYRNYKKNVCVHFLYSSISQYVSGIPNAAGYSNIKIAMMKIAT